MSVLLAQEKACAICRGVRPYRLAVDHCHRSGEIRGLLCKLCNNRLLPASRDKPEVLDAAAAYLRLPPVRAVLGSPRYVPTEEKP